LFSFSKTAFFHQTWLIQHLRESWTNKARLGELGGVALYHAIASIYCMSPPLLEPHGILIAPVKEK